MQSYEGGCHCKRVRFRIVADLSVVSECNCSICTKKGFLHLIVPAERFQLLSGNGDLATYEFNTGVAKHFSAEFAAFIPSMCQDRTLTNSTSTCAAWTLSMFPPLNLASLMEKIGRQRWWSCLSIPLQPAGLDGS
jgi:hypothetical protein